MNHDDFDPDTPRGAIECIRRQAALGRKTLDVLIDCLRATPPDVETARSLAIVLRSVAGDYIGHCEVAEGRPRPPCDGSCGPAFEAYLKMRGEQPEENA